MNFIYADVRIQSSFDDQSISALIESMPHVNSNPMDSPFHYLVDCFCRGVFSIYQNRTYPHEWRIPARWSVFFRCFSCSFIDHVTSCLLSYFSRRASRTQLSNRFRHCDSCFSGPACDGTYDDALNRERTNQAQKWTVARAYPTGHDNDDRTSLILFRNHLGNEW